MAVVTSTFNTTTSTNWASSTWVSTDPSWKLNTELTNWITAINDPNVIELVQNPGNATSRTTTSYVKWMLRARESDTSSDYGIIFADRYAGTGNSSSPDQTYYARTVSTSNNNYGTFSTVGSSIGNEDFTVATNFFTAYEASGSTPWFVFCNENATKTARSLRMLLRYDNSSVVAGSYIPTGIGKWLYFNQGSVRYPINNVNAPYKGAPDSTAAALRGPIPFTTYGNGYFFRLGTQYGCNHAAGTVTNDIIVSNTSTGVWGDTTVLEGVTYTCMGNTSSVNHWVKTSA